MESHINVIAALRIGLSIFGLLIGGIIFILLYVVKDFVDDSTGVTVLTILANVIMIVVLVLSIPGIIAGIGLLKRKEWARILTLILSVLDLFNVPIGTAIGAYSLWALVQPETVAIFKNEASTGAS